MQNENSCPDVIIRKPHNVRLSRRTYTVHTVASPEQRRLQKEMAEASLVEAQESLKIRDQQIALAAQFGQTLVQENEDLSKKVEETERHLRQQLDAQTRTMQQQEAELVAMRASQADFRAKLAALDATLHQRSEELEEVCRFSEALEQANAHMAERLQAVNAECSQLRSILPEQQTFKNDLTHALAKIASLEKQLMVQTEEIQNITASKAFVLASLESAEQELSRAQTQNTVLLKRLETASHATNKVEAMEEELNHVLTELSVAQEQMQEIDVLRQNLTALQEENQTLREQCAFQASLLRESQTLASPSRNTPVASSSLLQELQTLLQEEYVRKDHIVDRRLEDNKENEPSAVASLNGADTAVKKCTRSKATPEIKSDVLKEYFHLTALALKVKLQRRNMECNVSINSVYHECMSQEVPFEMWHAWLEDRLVSGCQSPIRHQRDQSISTPPASVIRSITATVTPIQDAAAGSSATARPWSSDVGNESGSKNSVSANNSPKSDTGSIGNNAAAPRLSSLQSLSISMAQMWNSLTTPASQRQRSRPPT